LQTTLNPMQKKKSKESYTEFLLDQFSDTAAVTAKKMFGGVGFFRESLMFGMIDGSGHLLFKVDESNLQDYKDHGSEPFKSPSKKGSMPYWTVPAEVIEDRHQLNTWADKAFAVALKKQKK
ncbi:MAG: TfoX/Sxy family protein, partial [Cyclobacteriaceae bacterium]